MTEPEKAVVTVHWSTGPVLCCVTHASRLLALGQFMGQHTPITAYVGEELCTTCVNEAKKNKKD